MLPRCACANIVTIFYIVCSASDGEDVRTCKEGQVCGQGQVQTDPLEKQAKPLKRVTTEDMIDHDIIARGLKDLGIAHPKRGKKTNLIRDSFIALLTLLGGEQVLHLCFRYRLICQLTHLLLQ